ncbi:unnamed protein product [Coregonus sp. 'balchen']|nr:unnamed protein product [Coregonus sp. 'balchen']
MDLDEKKPTPDSKYAWSQGDPRKVIYPTDSRGQFCGQAGTPLEKKPLLFYFNILKCASPLTLLEFQCPTTQLCVESCPTKHMTLLKAYLNKGDQEYYKQFCKEEVDFSKMSAPEILRDGLCPSMLMSSKPFTRRCLPALRTMKGGVVVVGNETIFDNGEGENVNATDFLDAAKKRVLIAIALIKEASRAVGHVMSSLFYPLLTFALLALVIAYWAITAVFLSTSNEQVYKVFNTTECEYSRDTCNPETFNNTNITAQCPDAECLFAFYGGETYYHKYLIVFQFYNVFLFFWCANFVTALGQVTLAGAFASYYWAFKKPDDIPANPIFSSLGRALRYHTGSLAFGSLILSLVQVIRVLLEYLDHKLKAAQNRFAKFLLSCLKCCFWCLEKFIKFLNRNAYIMVAIYGKSFCTSARDAFFLLMRNIIRVAVLDKVTDFLLFLGKLLIVGIVGICSFFFFSGRIKAVEQTAPSLNYYWVPILTVVVGSYLIAHGFFSVYAMCVDTLFLCFLEDLERNDGTAERPYFMSQNLLTILKKSNEDQTKTVD